MLNKYGADDSEREDMFLYSGIHDRIKERRRISAKLGRKEARRAAFKRYFILFVIGFTAGCVLNIAGNRMDQAGKTPDPVPAAVAAETEAHDGTEAVETVVAENAAEPVTDAPDGTKEAPVQETSSTWHNSTKTHDITVNSLIRYDNDHVVANFSDCTAVGYGLDSGRVISAEADFGFEVSVLDTDRVAVRMYDNSGQGIRPVFLTAGLAGGDLALETSGDDLFVLPGYGACPDGLGVISVTFSDETTLSAGVFKEQGKLFAVNIAEENDAVATVNVRENIAGILDGIQITPEDALFTDPIYYPIVPVTGTETTDTGYWLEKSGELAGENWSDAHKVQAFYSYITQNMAYDYYVLSQNEKSRSFLLEDYSGDLYASRTHIGICQDFSDIMAIMCRGQGIPALTMSNGRHAVTIVYIGDYGRWMPIDCTSDVKNGVYGEDMTAWVKEDRETYAHFDRLDPAVFDSVHIGNGPDMDFYGIPDPYRP